MRAFVAMIDWDLRRGCHSYHPIKNYKMRRLVHESVRADLKVPDGAEGGLLCRASDLHPLSTCKA
jgi:hypothetical protein